MKSSHFIQWLWAICVITCSNHIAVAQEGKPAIQNTCIVSSTAVVSPGLSTTSAGLSGVDHLEKPLSFQVISRRPKPHYKPETQVIKEAKNVIKSKGIVAEEQRPELESVVMPVVDLEFEANWMLEGTPPDDAMSVSKSGYIVACNNDGIEYYSTQGQFLFTNVWADFFSRQNLRGNIFDPRVIYDSRSDRFIMVVLHGSTPANSTVVVCFSQSDNPLDGWHTYLLTGNPVGNNWFDYPNLGLSNNEVYITGNLFNSNDQFDQAVIYQIPKANGLAGQSLDWQYWHNLSRSPFDAFTLVPALYAHEGSYGPGAYFVSNEPSGSNVIRLWDLTDDMDGSPELKVYNVDVPAYEPAGDAFQRGSNERLDNGDCRIQHALYLNKIVHLVFTTDIGDGWNGIYYGRLELPSLDFNRNTFGLSGSYDYSYPGIASFTSNATDQSVRIGFLRSSDAIFPEVRVVNCDNDFNWSPSVLVKSGENYVNIVSGDERWGDYTAMSRDHWNGEPAVWLSGSYGGDITSRNAFNTWKTRVAKVTGGNASSVSNPQIISEGHSFPNPFADRFNYSFELLTSDGKIIHEFFEDRLRKGSHTVRFNNQMLMAGTYFLKIIVNGKTIGYETLIAQP